MSDTNPVGEDCWTFGELLWYFTLAGRRGYTVHDHIQTERPEVRRFFVEIQIIKGVDLGDERDEPGRSLKTMRQLRAEVTKLSGRPFSVVEALPLTAFWIKPDHSEQPAPPLVEGETPATNAAGQVNEARSPASPDLHPPPLATSGEAVLGSEAGGALQAKQYPSQPKRKKSTQKGEARTKLISALTKHHKYSNGGCGNLEPIGNNELARLADVDKGSASQFFADEFDGHTNYRTIFCTNSAKLVYSLKLLNGEVSPKILQHGLPASEVADPR